MNDDLWTPPESMEEVLHPGSDAEREPEFPHAPRGWKKHDAISVAETEDLTLSDDHWEVLRALQEYYARHHNGNINARELHDALDEKFHNNGGIKYLYKLLPGGPVAQGCRLAGLHAPAGASDEGMGSVI
ncbi:MAG: TusE/DsrC/DsvC family sulfur relay protein [Granulosicoccaceae bacterium]|jgi:tRNA 2-thiouridine synthesizing protein E